MKNQKKLIILTGPSGVGKGTVVQEIIGKEKDFWLSISATTREPREGEKDGENYYFLNQGKFKEMIEQTFSLNGLNSLGTTMELLYPLLMRKSKRDLPYYLKLRWMVQNK